MSENKRLRQEMALRNKIMELKSGNLDLRIALREAEQRAERAESHLRAVVEQIVQSVDDGSKFIRGDVVGAAANWLENK